MSHVFLFTRALLACLFLGLGAAAAQDAPPAEPVSEPVSEEVLLQEAASQTLANFAQTTGIDYSAWAELAVQTETALAAVTPSSFALTRLRDEILPWRTRFDAARSLNAARLSTVEAQLNALGAAAVAGENPAITQRRSELAAQIATLRAPSALAQEAYIRADGLITEIDRNARALQASQLVMRNASLLDLSLWPQVYAAVSGRAAALGTELSSTVGSAARWARLGSNAVLAFAALAGGAVLLVFAPMAGTRLRARFVKRAPNAESVIGFGMSVLRLGAQIGGVLLITYGLKNCGLFGYRMGFLINALPAAGAMLFASRWVGSRFFTQSRENPAPFDFNPAEKQRGKSLMTELGTVLALGTFVSAFMATGDTSPSIRNAVSVPIVLLVAFTLYRLGRFLSVSSASEASDTAGDRLREGLLWGVGSALVVSAVLGPVLSILGYARAGEWLLYPSAITLFLVAALLAIQWFVFDLHALWNGSREAASNSLVPVLFGIALVLVALPLLALIWGARVEDLVEFGTKLASGISIGEITLAPLAILTGIIIFVIGYFATRFVQAMLGSSVLPKTRLDKGGQAAVVSIVGYIGLALAAVLAISSAGLNLSSIAVVAGALSVGIGFGLQDIVKNFISGIILILGRPVSQGDWIEVAGFSGYVREISIRSTRIETFDRSDVIIPNTDLVAGRVVNWTRGNSVGRITVSVTAAYGNDPERVMEILRDVVAAQPMVLLSTPPVVQLVGFAADTMNFEAKALVRDINSGGGVRAAIYLEVAKRFAQEGIQSRNGLVAVPKPEPEAPILQV